MPTGAVSREEGPAIVEKIWDNPRELELKTRTVSIGAPPEDDEEGSSIVMYTKPWSTAMADTSPTISQNCPTLTKVAFAASLWKTKTFGTAPGEAPTNAGTA